MKKMLQSYNFIDTLGESYEALLESAQKKAHQSGTAFHLLINAFSGNNTTDPISTKLDNSVKDNPGLATPYNFIDALGEAYEALLETALRKAHVWSSAFRQMTDVFFGNNGPDGKSTQPGQHLQHAVVTLPPRHPSRTDRY